MGIARFAVTRPVAVTMRIAALVLLGVICLTKLPVDLLPKVTIPTISVSTSWPNVAPEVIEAQVTRPIEEAVSAATNLYQVNSSTSQGTSSVRIQFQWGTDIGQAAVEVLQLVQRAQARFPIDSTLGTPAVRRFDPNQMSILTFGVSGEPNPVKLRSILDNDVSPILESAAGVASVTASGGLQRAVIVDVDPVKLRAHHLTLDAVTRHIANENLNLPAGVGKQGDTEYTVRSVGWYTSPEDIADTPVGSFDGQNVALREVATVRDSHAEVRSYTRLDGKQSASLDVAKLSGANTVDTARAVMAKLEAVKKQYPQLRFQLVYDQSTFIADSVRDLKTNAIIGAVLAVLILLFFLRNVRSTLVVALSIPTSIISTFALLYLGGFTLNTMSLGGLALATGLIVDDAVVVLENIFRHIERDKQEVRDAAINGTGEIISAVVASTWTVMVVFLPLLLIKGQSGQMFTQFALVVIFSLAVSLLDATTIVPMLATRLIHLESHLETVAGRHGRHPLGAAFAVFGRWFDALDAAYRRGLYWALHHRAYTLGGALAITAGSFLIFPMIGTEMMPATDSGSISVSVRLPVGTAVAKTNEAMKRIETLVSANPNVEAVLSSTGSGRFGGRLVTNSGSLTVLLKEKRKVSTEEVINELRPPLGQIPGVTARPEQHDIVSMLMTGGHSSVEVDIFGEDLGELTRLGRDVMARIKDVPGLENVDLGWQEAMPEIQWQADRQKVRQFGLSFADVADTIGTATNGTIASYYQESGFQYPIIVQATESSRKTVEGMSQLAINPGSGSASGSSILLGQIAKPIYGLGPSEITRLDRQRFISVAGVPQGRATSEIQKDVEAALRGLDLPSGYRWDWGREQKRRAEEFGGLGLAVFMAIALIYMLLASQFESFIHPFTILLSVPLAATGVILGLFLTGRSFGLTAFIGVLMLVGIVSKNGILLVDYTNLLRRRGMPLEEALLTAGPTRLRPILMTASAAMLGMFPIALALGKGSEIQAPMATAVIGGLMTSTCLTLFVVPTVYAALDRFVHHEKEEHNP